MICRIFHNVKRSVFLRGFTRSEKRKRRKPGVVNEVLQSMPFLPLNWNWIFSLLHFDIVILSRENFRVVLFYYLWRTYWLLILMRNRLCFLYYLLVYYMFYIRPLFALIHLSIDHGNFTIFNFYFGGLIMHFSNEICFHFFLLK